MGSLNSIPLCSRGRVGEVDGNNNIPGHPDREQLARVVEVQPEATSTPKLRRIEPLPERDLGESSNSDSLVSELEISSGDPNSSSDSGLDPSGDEFDISKRSNDFNADPPTNNDHETTESLENGDLGVDKVHTFRSCEMEHQDKDSEIPADQVDEEKIKKEREEMEARVASKVESLGGDTEAAITSLLTDLVVSGGVESER